MKVIGDRLSVEAHNDRDAETLALEGTITPNDFGGAGAAWYGTVSRGNSNVYSRFEITYPGVVSTCPPPPGSDAASGGASAQPGETPSTAGSPTSGVGPAGSSARGSCGLGAPSRPAGGLTLLGLLLLGLRRRRQS
jgi:hypothetical protein